MVVAVQFPIVFKEVLILPSSDKNNVHIDVKLQGDHSRESAVLYFEVYLYSFKSPFTVLAAVFFNGALNLAFPMPPSILQLLPPKLKKKKKKTPRKPIYSPKTQKRAYHSRGPQKLNTLSRTPLDTSGL